MLKQVQHDNAFKLSTLLNLYTQHDNFSYSFLIAKNHLIVLIVIPAKAGIQSRSLNARLLS
jgi:hypothetical protein